nr:MAG TPA: minor tail protein [Caudoviricetes sp.]
MAADGSVIIDTRMDTTGVQNGVSAIKQSFNGLGSAVKKIGLLIGGAFAVGKLVQFGKECVELGSDLTEVQNVVDVTFTTMSDKVNEFAKNAMTSAGLSETMAKRYVGTFGAMSKSFGFSESQAYDMSTALTQLTGDVASFYNISQDLAYIKLKSVFTGETETLKDLGVVMTQSALDQYALANGYGKTTSEMTEQEKVALRLAFVQKQLSAASGDFIRTSDSWANQVRVMQLQLQSLKATVGQGLINIFTPVLKVINVLLGKLATLANAFKSFTELITGKKSSGQTSGSGAGLAGTDAIADTADQYGQAADNAEKLADATNDNAKATKKANKETKNYLSSLDEVHKASSTGSSASSTPSGSGSGGTGSGGGGLPSSVGSVDYGSLAEGETALDKISDSAKKLADLLKKLWKPFQDAWKKEGKNTIDAANIALSGIAKLAKSVGKSLVEVWTNGTGTTMLTTMLRIAQNVLKTIGNIASGFADAWNKNNVGTQIIQNIADALVVVMQFVEKIAEDTATWAANLNFYPLLESISNLTATFAPILESIGNVFEWIYNNIILPMLKWVIETGLPTVINLIADLVGFFTDHQSIIEAFGTALIGAFAAEKIAVLAKSISGSITTVMDFTKGLIALMTGSGGIIGGIKAIATAIGPGGIFIAAVTACIAIGVLLYKNWDKIKEVAGIVASAVVGFFKTMGEGVSMILSDLKETVTGILNAIGTLVSNVISSIVKFVTSKTREMAEAATRKISDMKEKTSTLWNGMKANAKETWENIMTIVGNKVAAIRDAIVNKFTSARNRVVEIFGGIRDTIRNILNKVIGIVNRAIGTVNSAIGGIESAFSFGPWEVPTPFGKKTIGFSATFPRIPTVPYLAKGAVIPPRSEFLAVLGDQKNGRNLEAPEGVIKDIIDDAFARHQQNSTGNVRFTAQINRRTVFDEIIEEAKLRRDTSGRNPFELA